MLRDNLVELIEPMLNSAGADPLALYIHTRTPASDDRLPCLKNPRPEGAESSLTESASSPFQAEPAHKDMRVTLRTVLASLAAGDSAEEILADFPSLKPEDVQAAIAFAAASAEEDLPVPEIPHIQ